MIAYDCSEGERYALLQMTDIGRMGAGLVLRSPDAACNPYLMLAVVLSAGLDGIRNNMEIDINSEYVSNLPRTLEDAIKAYKADEFIQNVLGSFMSDKLVSRKKKEWKEYCRQVSSWEIDQYLDKI